MTTPVLRPLSASRARWVAPATDTERWEKVRERLAEIVSVPHTHVVYTAHRRGIFRVDDPVLGPLAVKELRHDGLARQLVFRTLRAADAVHEFSVGTAFEARGGRTPHFLGAALDRGVLTLRRVLLFIEWIEDAETLTAFLARLDDPPPAAVLDAVAEEVLAAARLGLVHGRHSSDNLLVDSRGAQPQIYTIDFAYSQLGEGFDESAYVRDVARMAHWLWHEEACTAEALSQLLARCARAVEAGDADQRLEAIEAELAWWQASRPRTPQRLVRTT